MSRISAAPFHREHVFAETPKSYEHSQKIEELESARRFAADCSAGALLLSVLFLIMTA